jgi:hypothetical protein
VASNKGSILFPRVFTAASEVRITWAKWGESCEGDNGNSATIKNYHMGGAKCGSSHL